MSKPFSIKNRQIDDITVLDLSGDLSFGAPAAQLRKAIGEVQNTRLLLNFSDVSQIDSAGLGEVVSSGHANFKGGMGLYGLSNKVRHNFVTTNLHKLLNISAGEQEAIAKLDPAVTPNIPEVFQPEIQSQTAQL